MNSKSKAPSIPSDRPISWEDWLKGRAARRALSRRIAGSALQRRESSSDSRLRKMFAGKRGLPFSNNTETTSKTKSRKASVRPRSDVRRVAIESNAIRSAGYSPSNKLLEIKFRSGKIYRYFGVPKAAFDALLNAPSAGAFLNMEIKGRYEFEMVDS
jgi:hypothetical protein